MLSILDWHYWIERRPLDFFVFVYWTYVIDFIVFTYKHFLMNGSMWNGLNRSGFRMNCSSSRINQLRREPAERAQFKHIQRLERVCVWEEMPINFGTRKRTKQILSRKMEVGRTYNFVCFQFALVFIYILIFGWIGSSE